MQAIHQFTMGRYMLHTLTLGELVNGLFFQWVFLETEGKTYEIYMACIGTMQEH